MIIEKYIDSFISLLQTPLATITLTIVLSSFMLLGFLKMKETKDFFYLASASGVGVIAGVIFGALVAHCATIL